MKLSKEQVEKFWGFVISDDLDFYEAFTIQLSDEDQKEFFETNPDFLSDYPAWEGNIEILKDKSFRKIMRKIKKYEDMKRKNGENNL